MSFGALSANAIEALSGGAARGVHAHLRVWQHAAQSGLGAPWDILIETAFTAGIVAFFARRSRRHVMC
jgi:hypothetical protein